MPVERSNANRSASHRAEALQKRTGSGALMPLLLGFLFFLFEEILVLFIFFVFVGFLGRLKLERIGAQHLQIGPTLIATNRIALVDIVFVNIDHCVTNRALDMLLNCHRESSKILLIAEYPAYLQA